METDARYTLVGLIMIGLIGGLAFSLIWLSHSGSNEDFPGYTIYFQEQSPAGLQVDGNVTMRGIKVGKIKKLEISRKNIQQVRVIIEAQPGTFVKKDTRAVIQRNFLTGLANIDLIGGSQETESLTEILPDENYPVIAEGSTGLDKLQKTLPEILSSANTLLDSANRFMSDENLAHFQHTIKNIDELSDTITKNRGQIDKIVSDTSKVIEDIQTVTRELKNGVGETSESLRAAITALSISVTSVSENVTRAAKSFKSTADRIDNPLSIITGPEDGSLGPGESK